MLLNEQDLTCGLDFEHQLEGINMMQLFSLAKRNPISRSKDGLADIYTDYLRQTKIQRTEDVQSQSISLSEDNENLRKLIYSNKKEIDDFYKMQQKLETPSQQELAQTISNVLD